MTLVTPEQAQLAAALVLLAPGVPLLFMGEEYGDPAPFPYFIDHGDPALVEAVRAGRAQEFAAFAESGGVLDADAQSTFDAAHIDPSLRHRGEHRCRWALHRALIGLRRTHPALQRSSRLDARAFASAHVVTLLRSGSDGAVAAFFNVSPDTAEAELPAPPLGWHHAGEDSGEEGPRWSKLLDARASEFGGHGDALPTRLAPGERAQLGPWEFCAYGLPGKRGDA